MLSSLGGKEEIMNGRITVNHPVLGFETIELNDEGVTDLGSAVAEFFGRRGQPAPSLSSLAVRLNGVVETNAEAPLRNTDSILLVSHEIQQSGVKGA